MKDLPNIHCVYICQPIPSRKFDWIAYRDGEEEYGLRGYGETNEKAIENLLRQEEEVALCSHTK